MPCCKCNRTGSCRGCACVKARRPCVNCLPSKLGTCANSKTCTTPQTQPVTDLIDAHLVNANTSNPPTTVSTPVSTPEVDSDVSSNPQPTPQPTNRENEQIPNLPSPTPINAHVFTMGHHNATDFSDMLEATYNEVIYWRRNCFTVPLGRIGKEFVSELSKL